MIISYYLSRQLQIMIVAWQYIRQTNKQTNTNKLNDYKN